MTKLRVSLVVIAYNMARELPRTLQTLSPACQRGVDASDYEVIVVDNGSTTPFDRALCSELCPNVRILDAPAPTPSPVSAINHGLAQARGDLVGVLIDGARMASPGLVATALDAAKLHPRPVIGTLAFHLGPEVQMRSVAKGYNQDVEDALLASVDWVGNGYQLFSISVFAGSSALGWFTLPVETNALFLTRQQWQDLGGYDPAFVSPGGGLVNLDTWARACDDEDARVMLLLGEATFHQVHGGIATNAPTSRRKELKQEFHDEYERIRGRAWQAPTRQPVMVGSLSPEAMPSLAASVAPAPK